MHSECFQGTCTRAVSKLTHALPTVLDLAQVAASGNAGLNTKVQCTTHIAQSLKAWYRLVLVRTCHAATMSSRRERLRQPGTIQRSSLHPRTEKQRIRAAATSIRRVGSMLADRSTRAVMLVMAAMRLQAASTSCAMCSSHSAQTGSSTDLVAPLLLAATAYHGQRLCEASAHDDSLQSNGVVPALSVLEF